MIIKTFKYDKQQYIATVLEILAKLRAAQLSPTELKIMATALSLPYPRVLYPFTKVERKKYDISPTTFSISLKSLASKGFLHFSSQDKVYTLPLPLIKLFSDTTIPITITLSNDN